MASVLKKSNLFDCISADRFELNRCDNFKEAANAFRQEAIVALSVRPIDSEEYTLRYELLRPFVIKTLLFVNLVSDCRTVGLMARILEILAIHPELELNTIIINISENSGMSVDSISRLIDRYFDIYNKRIFERVTFLTRTNPFTAKDILCDLAFYVRTKFY